MDISHITRLRPGLMGALCLVAAACLVPAAARPAHADEGPRAAPSWSDTRWLIPPPPPAVGLPGEAEALPAAPEGLAPALESADDAQPGPLDDPLDDPPAPAQADDEGSEDAPAAGGAPPAEAAKAGAGEGAETLTGSAPQPEVVLDDVTPARRGPRLTRLPVEGSLRLNYRLRTTGDESDNDLYQYLVLKIGDENKTGWSYSFHGRLTEDLDGRSDSSGFYVFDSITDTYKHRVNGRVYNLYANYRSRGGAFEQIRIGRQWIEGGELFHVDGIRADMQRGGRGRGLGVSLFAGLPVHLFESSPEGDFIGGFSLYGTPWVGSEVRFDYTYLNDDTRYYGNEADHLMSLTWRQRVSRTLSWWGTYQHLDSDPRTLRLAFNGMVPESDFYVRGSFYALLTAQKERVTELDPYYAVAQDLKPYWLGDLSISKGLANRLFFEAGVALRRLFTNSDEGTFNRDFSRYWVALTADQWPGRNLYVTLSGERWVSDDRAYTLTADVEFRPSRNFRFQFGTDYSAYRFDLYAVKERQSVRGYYARLIVRTGERWRWHLRARLEDDKFDTYFTLNTGFEVEF